MFTKIKVRESKKRVEAILTSGKSPKDIGSDLFMECHIISNWFFKNTEWEIELNNIISNHLEKNKLSIGHDYLNIL